MQEIQIIHQFFDSILFNPKISKFVSEYINGSSVSKMDLQQLLDLFDDMTNSSELLIISKQAETYENVLEIFRKHRPNGSYVKVVGYTLELK